RVRTACIAEGAVPRRQLLFGENVRLQRLCRALQVRRERLVRPVVTPLVVRRSTLEHDTRVVGRAAAEDPGPRLGAIFLVVALPEMRLEREPAGIEDARGPAPLSEMPVVGPGLDEADGALGVLAQPPCECAARRAAAEDQDVEALSSHSFASATERSRTKRGSPA